MTPASSTSSSDFYHRHTPKRMRLGTRSCAECRRRRVRCTFPSDGRACEACSLHGVDCVPQKPTGQGKGAQYDPEKVELQRRLANLEAMVRQISTSANIEPETTTWAQLQLDSQKRLQSPSVALEADSIASSTRFSKLSDTDLPTDSADEMDQFEDAPLVTLFKDALKIERPPPEKDGARYSTDYRITAVIEDISPALPTLDDLRLVLEASQRFWSIWPMRPPGQGATGASRILLAQNFIVDSLNSGRPVIMAKALVWLTLCMHQLPRDFACQGTEFRRSRGHVLKRFLNAADTLLSIEGETGQGQGKDLLECLELQVKVCIDLGRPRKAWLTNRRAVNTAMLLGFQNHDTTATDEQTAIWKQLWHADRLLSLVLGLPCAISDTHPSLAKDCAGPTIESQVSHELALIAGRIVDRNMNHKTVNYSVTMDIDQDLERCKSRMPLSWRKPEFDTTLPFELAHGQQSIKLFFFSMWKTLHLPYMFKSSSDRRYEYSRIAALEACRDCIRVYKGLRDNKSGDVPVICDLMDFLAFSATVTLVIHLLSRSSKSGVDGVGLEETEDWDLVHSVSAVLSDVANKLSCSVAGQGSNLLDRLIMARRGKYADTEPFEAVIPYFGKVRIGRIPRVVKAKPTTQVQTPGPQMSAGLGAIVDGQSQSVVAQSQSSITSPTTLGLSSSSVSASSSSSQDLTSVNTVEFNLSDTTSFGQCPMDEWMSDAELTVDWESFIDVNMNYDWSQFFESAMPD
ncbi:hypothetical protein PV08_02968 [Exophiala spinifera]|uniref:Zn(2)-C6 fungal-type domain-containing protein n=1 Tax=Exophiala spinifera TaxID=91928 RepID=A0A0D2C505_9EURO|nr:uncharacterized protein PV08_02968 [Exophiala spinifera]KIW18679.1 hypothetical protein PV08_02968 [Exophiala spinifera]